MMNINDYTMHQLIDGDIEEQAKDYDEGYLSGAKIGDWVWLDSEVYVSQKCINHWLATTHQDYEKLNLIYNHLELLNSERK